MPPHLRALLAEMQEWGRTHDEHEPEKARRMLNLRPETAQLIYILARSSRCTRLLEIGTSNGYSTIWLAWCASQQGGRVTSIDHSAAKLSLADANLRRAGLRDMVDLRHGDATETVGSLTGPFDFVLFDSVQVRPYAQLPLLIPKLADNSLVLADNVLSHPQEMQPYLELVGTPDLFEHTIIAVGKGLSVALKTTQKDQYA